jgi:hypothetical protein
VLCIEMLSDLVWLFVQLAILSANNAI